MSHFGRPKDGPTEKYSLKHLVNHLIKLLDGATVKFADDCIGESAVKESAALQAGEVLLLENLRFYKEEEKGDVAFAEKLSKLGDIYVNDAFGTAHRAHASTAVIAQFFPGDKKMFGLVMEGEVASAEKVMHQSEKPFTAIIGGAKVSDKILIIENLLERATDIIIGGGMAYTFMKAQGGVIGNSLCENDRLDTAIEILKKQKQREFVFTCLLILLLQMHSLLLLIHPTHLVTIFLTDGWDWISGPTQRNNSLTLSKDLRPFYGMVRWVFLKWKNSNTEPKPLQLQLLLPQKRVLSL